MVWFMRRHAALLGIFLLLFGVLAPDSGASLTLSFLEVSEWADGQSAALHLAQAGVPLPGGDHPRSVSLHAAIGARTNISEFSGMGVVGAAGAFRIGRSGWIGPSVTAFESELTTVVLGLHLGRDLQVDDPTRLRVEAALGHQWRTDDRNVALQLPPGPGEREDQDAALVIDSMILEQLLGRVVLERRVWSFVPGVEVGMAATWYRVEGSRCDPEGFLCPPRSSPPITDSGFLVRAFGAVGLGVELGQTRVHAGLRWGGSILFVTLGLGARF
jgi:hypothetical protein